MTVVTVAHTSRDERRFTFPEVASDGRELMTDLPLHITWPFIDQWITGFALHPIGRPRSSSRTLSHQVSFFSVIHKNVAVQ